MKKKSYGIAFVLTVMSLLFMLGGIVFAGNILLNGTHTEITAFGTEETVKGASKEAEMLAMIAVAICVGQFIIFKRPLSKYMEEAVMDNEYDEFGRNKKKTYNKLSRQEREAIDAANTARAEQLLPTSVIKKITKQGSLDPDKDLYRLIGLTGIKHKVFEMTARMKFEMETYKEDKKKYGKKAKDPRGNNGRHFVFVGPPGTGKTTLARIMTGFLYRYGYIKKNKIIEINGGFLKAGEYSEEKTRMVIRQAYDGVLFIDEAYSIIEGNRQYGKAVIAELIKEMEDNRDRFTVIIAGYKDDIKRLLDANEGFKSRVRDYVEFPDYNSIEMRDIFIQMANEKGFMADADAMDNFDLRVALERKLPTFGNGRTARNILDEAIDRHAVNYGNGDIDKNDRYVLKACDISPRLPKNMFT